MERELGIEEYIFKDVDINVVRCALQRNLMEFFKDVNVEIIDCPNMSSPPFNLSAKGFGGGATGIIDLGGPPYLVPLVDRSKIYDLAKILPKCVPNLEFPNGFYVSGAAAGPWPSQGSNSEMMVNMSISKDGEMIQNKSRVSLTTGSGDEVVLKELDEQESRCALLGNLMVSSGIPGKVLEIKCTNRIHGEKNLTTSIRSALSKEFPTVPIGLGGVFLVQNSKTKIHVMQDFSVTPLLTDTDVNNWLRFFDTDPPMLFQSVLVSIDPGLDLRMEHSHGWSLTQKVGGHYHYDVSPESVEYVGYYAIAQKLWRIDKPEVTHLIGRD